MPNITNPALAVKDALRRLLADDDARTATDAPTPSSRSRREHRSGRASLSESAATDGHRSGREATSRHSQAQQDSSETSRSGRQQHSHGETDDAPHPEALPSVDFYEHFPAYVGATANVVVASPMECEVLRLAGAAVEVVEDDTERNVSERRFSRADVENGGFLLYQADTKEAPQYFLLDTAEEQVYGSATYLPTPHKPEAETRRLPQNSSSHEIC